MKLKYYLRGVGLGVIVTTIILAIAFSGKSKDMSDLEIINRAKELGMVMDEGTVGDKNTEQTTEVNKENNPEKNSDISTETNSETGTEINTEASTENVPVEDENRNQVDSESQEDIEDKADPYILTIERGQYARAVCENLAAEGIVPDAEEFRKYLQSTNKARGILAGNYAIPRNSSYEEIANILFAGPM